jgi:hypothetical protein
MIVPQGNGFVQEDDEFLKNNAHFFYILLEENDENTIQISFLLIELK